MKTYLIILVLAIGCFGCQKSTITNQNNPTPTSNSSYLKVTCYNCQVQYGMPDQYRQMNVSGISLNAPFNYSPGYVLQVYLTALDKPQAITLSVYDVNGNVLYSGSKVQSTVGYWDVEVLTSTTQ
ncbi:MAG: hypothetical protein ACXVAY_15595 [Mucilaginibacter sp.]